MSCGRQNDRYQTTFSSGTPHFFKIILEETLEENKLRIPLKFVRKYGETLSNSVFVKLPCGSKWKMKLTKEEDNIWLEKGWPDFVKHYSIKRGSMLIFRYEGNSEFHAVIFDTSTVEIDYPSVPVDFDKSDSYLEPQATRDEVVEDDSVEIFDDLFPCPKAREISPLSCCQPHKRMRKSPNECILENSISKGNLPNSEPEMIGKHDFTGKSDRDKSTTGAQKINENINQSGGALNDEICELSSLDHFPAKQASGCMSTPWRTSQGRFSHTEKARIIERVTFESEKPFFKLLMQPTYVGSNCSQLNLPFGFAERHILNECDVVLSIPNGRSWSTQLRRKNQKTWKFASLICNGWREFSIDNDLKIGDVCIFELINGTKISFLVSIVRVSEFKHQESQGKPDFHAKSDEYEYTTRRQKIHPKLNISGGPINDEICKTSSLDNFPAKQAAGCKSTPCKTRQRPLTFTEKARILERVPFESEKPFFKILMQPTYVGSTAEHLSLPINFAMTHIKNQGDVVLTVPNGRSWSAKIRMTPPRFANCVATICKGWYEFANDNNLEVGDVCIFKLLAGAEISFEVSIVRFADYAQLESVQAGDSATGAGKAKGDLRVEIGID